MNKLDELARDPEAAALIGAAAGAVKGALVGLAIGKLATCVAIGMVGGAVSASVLSHFARRRGENSAPQPVPVRIRTPR